MMAEIMAKQAAAGNNPNAGLTYDPEKYNKKEFDEVWQIQYKYGSGGGGRKLGKSKDRIKSKASHERWKVEGKVVEEGFAPQFDDV